MKDRKKKSNKAGVNSNKEHSLYLINIIVLCAITLVSIISGGLFFIRMRDAQRNLIKINNQITASEGEKKSLYTSEEVDESRKTARAEGARDEKNAILMQIQSSLEAGNSTTQMLRTLFDDDVVVQYNDKYYFYPVLSGLEKNPYMETDFHIDNNGDITYVGNDASIELLHGIDVSESSGSIDWSVLNDRGIDFAMIRLGERTEDGELRLDERAEYNIRSAGMNSIKTGVYFVSDAADAQEASEEAAWITEKLDAFADQSIMYTAVVQRISSKDERTSELDRAARTANVAVLCEELKKNGQDPIVYGGLAAQIMFLDQHRIAGYDKWISSQGGDLYFPYDFSMWKYCRDAVIDGIENPVSRDVLITHRG